MLFFNQGARRALMAGMLAVSVGLTGCASTGSSLLGGAQPDARLTQGSDATFFSRSGMQACTAGAALAITACLVAASGDNKLLCAVAAGVAACGVAMGTNYYLDHRRSQYNSTSEMLDAISNDIQQDTDKLRQRATTMQAVIDSDKQKLAALEAEVRQQKLDEASARKQLATVDADIQRMQRELNNVDKRAEAYREAAAGTSGGDKLDARIKELEGEAAQLHNALGGLIAQRDSLDWGKQA